MKKALVIGGMNIDILGTPSGAFHSGDSLPGHIRLSVGGVGYNIASKLSESGVKVYFFTVLGDDLFASLAKNACYSSGIDISHALMTHSASPSYMAIHSLDGSMTAAINDMSALNLVNPEYLASKSKILKADFDLCVIDANLPEEAIKAIPHLVSSPILADPVSCEKGLRLLPVLSSLTAIKPNAMEALALSGLPDIPDAAKWFLDHGTEQVYISLGRDGVYYAGNGECGYLPIDKPMDVPATGAGDAMAAGLARAIMKKASPREAAHAGLLAATQFLESKKRSESDE
ncbi:MAG: PfkB family carbohydrate kinase [Christensenellales bacterium]|jgi:pseudouridine kinase